MPFTSYRVAKCPNRNTVTLVTTGPQKQRLSSPAGHSRVSFFICLLALCAPLLLTLSTSAQSTAPTAASTNRPVVHRKTRRHSKKKEPVPAVIAPAAPPPPVPPAQQPARPARIDFSQGLLRIDAENASLIEILNQISHHTGLAVEGLDHDERVYGQYGPGTVTSTLTKLLDGAGYNYVIVGGAGDATPRKLILTQGSNFSAGNPAAPVTATGIPSAASAGGASSSANPSEPARPKTPQQIFDELRRMHPQQQ